MKTTSTIVCAVLVTAFFATVAYAAKGDRLNTAKEASCIAEAKQRFSVYHPRKRKTFVRNCMRRY
jgi:hypothetical protein